MLLLALKLYESDWGVSQRVQRKLQGRTSEGPQHHQEAKRDQVYSEC